MAPGTRRNGKIDEQIEETFPASDPPSFMGGEVLGAPAGRKSPERPPAMAEKHRNITRKTKPAKTKRAAKKKPVAKKKKRATRKRKSR